MKTTSKTTCALLIAAFLSSSCDRSTLNTPAELAMLPVYELSHPQPAKVVRKNSDRSITGFLADCESQLDRIRDGLSTSIGQPHR
ncbi:MAG: hypothetical protein DYG98_00665 [Haliscomenobacteraceae bacterium CHB4]|nr:hypothetical protein [Saprospiraceae bacterium]MCE7921547.1 hypothetical protein [Haliscomenobacteraceae bacterium CHB4]